MIGDARDSLILWPTLSDEERKVGAEIMRPAMVESICKNLGAQTREEVRAGLELYAAACRAELDAADPSPMPTFENRRTRRGRKRERSR